MPNHLVIVGACVRQHLESAQRAGFETLGIDLFGDWDTHNAGACIKANSLDEMPGILRQNVRDDWCLAGGLERHLDPLFSGDLDGCFLGPVPDAMKLISDIHRVAETVVSNGFRFPTINFDPSCPPGSWIRKPMVSSGGLGVEWARQGFTRSPHEYFQPWIAGKTISAVFVTDARGTRVMGTTLQLPGRDLGLENRPFAYAGSIGPLQLEPEWESQVLDFGRKIGQAISLRGVWGADFVCRGDEVMVVDINPRLTASCDIYERAQPGKSIAGLHVRACRDPADCQGTGTTATGVPEDLVTGIGKAVVFSPHNHPIKINPQDHDYLTDGYRRDRPPKVADIPMPGTIIPANGPICTIYETISSPDFRLKSTTTEIDLPHDIKKMLNRLKKRASNVCEQLGIKRAVGTLEK